MAKKDYKYDTPEYRLEECKEAIDKAIEKVGQMRAEVLSIKPIDTISLGGWNNKRIPSFKRSLSDYFGGSSYSYFDEKRADHIEKCYAAAIKWHDQALVEVEKWHLENIPAIEHNTLVQLNVRNFMGLVGIPNTYSTSDYPTPRSRTKKTTTHAAGFVQDLSRNCSVSDGYGGVKVQLNSFKKDMDASRDSYLAKIKATQIELAKTDKQIRLVAKAMELAEKWGIKADTNEELIRLVTERAKDDYRESMEGDEISIKCCDDCSSWTVGEHRCSCGNRRMYLEVEGNILDGFNSYAMPD